MCLGPKMASVTIMGKGKGNKKKWYYKHFISKSWTFHKLYYSLIEVQCLPIISEINLYWNIYAFGENK